jgi:hypothetical protein
MGGIKITLSNNCCGQLIWNKNVVINVIIVNYFSSLVIIKLEAKMIKIIKMFMIITILIAGCVSATEADTESEEWKTFTNVQYGYSFEVPAFCFEGPLPGECKQSPPEERAEECLCFVENQRNGRLLPMINMAIHLRCPHFALKDRYLVNANSLLQTKEPRNVCAL